MSTKTVSRKLKDIATITVGYPLNKKSCDKDSFSYTLFDHNENGADPILQSYAEEIPEYYLTSVDDIIVCLSNTDKRITLIDESSAGLLVSSSYLIIRCKKSQAHPEYIFDKLIGLNHNSFMRDAVRTSQKIERLSSLKLKLPSLDEQIDYCDFRKKLELALKEFSKPTKQMITIIQPNQDYYTKLFPKGVHRFHIERNSDTGDILQSSGNSSSDSDESDH